MTTATPETPDSKKPSELSSAMNATPTSPLQKLANDTTAATFDAAAGVANKQLGMSRASNSNKHLVALARREALKLAQFGVVSIDDVQHALTTQGIITGGSSKKRMWMGSVFRTSEWLCIGNMPSRVAANNCRDVKAWVTKAWLQKNALNGTNWGIAAFSVARIFKEFTRAHPTANLARCNWMIGASALSSETQTLVKADGNMLYGIPVTVMPTGVGAMIVPPADYVVPPASLTPAA